MAVTDIPLLGAIKHKLDWLTDRQRLLAQNVANANTPDYGAKDLKRPDFIKMMEAEMNSTRMRASHARHMAAGSQPGPQSDGEPAPSWEVAPDGNSVRLEHEMIKVYETATEYRLATSLYSKATGLIKTALGTGR